MICNLNNGKTVKDNPVMRIERRMGINIRAIIIKMSKHKSTPPISLFAYKTGMNRSNHMKKSIGFRKTQKSWRINKKERTKNIDGNMKNSFRTSSKREGGV